MALRPSAQHKFDGTFRWSWWNAAAFICLALLLLVQTLRWHIPMMLWDQLDIVPMYQAWQDGTLSATQLFGFRAGHMHALAYAMLLATTQLSHGQLWLDCFANWIFLVVYASLVATLAWRTLPAGGRLPRIIFIAIVFFALYPGHLANLQWGWQVAVFMSLVATALAIDLLARCEWSALNIAAGLVAGLVAYLSFATGIALVPVAFLIAMLRADQPRVRRAIGASLWLVGGIVAWWMTRRYDTADMPAHPPFATFMLYAMNFLGAGIARFATDFAPLLALAALCSGVWAFLSSVDRARCLPWLGFFAFGIVCALVVALARAYDNGAQHAFVTRYVSLSSLFWIGWCGLIAGVDRWRRSRVAAVCVVLVFAVVNAVQMTKKAARVGDETRAIATALRDTYPEVDPVLLRSLYFDQPELTMQRLAALKTLGFPPFDAEPHAVNSK